MILPWSPLLAPPARGFEPDERPLGFSLAVRPGGYAWWYVDALSDEGDYGLTLIAFVGSVFSPWYARERRVMRAGGAPADPERHCAINVAIYRRQGRDVWAFTEHREFARERLQFRLGASALRWTVDDRGPRLEITIAERTAITGRAIRGRVILRPSALFGPRVALDPGERHRWYPIAPHARVEAEFERPELRFSGSGYHDVNEGDEGLEHAFTRWSWSRAELDRDRTAILYDVAGSEPRAFEFSPATRTMTTLDPREFGPSVALAKTGWRIERTIRSDRGTRPALIRTLEDTPFYSRNLIALTLRGQATTAVHESIDLQRFARAWVRFLLPFRIRRS
ncbi:carotenoid 1,2-hydratase [Nannocystaceae bacterium ST9]